MVNHMLLMPILNGRVGKWILALSEFDLKYESAKAVKGQVIADFITQHHKPGISYVESMPWTQESTFPLFQSELALITCA